MDPYTRTIGRDEDEQEIIDSLFSWLSVEVCPNCKCSVEPSHLEEVWGRLVCPQCKEDIQNDLKERELQQAMDKTDTDKLIALQMIISIAYQQFADKNGLENLHFWNNTVNEALKAKK